MLSQRLATRALVAAALMAAPRFADGGLLIDVRAFSRNGVAVANPKLLQVGVGDTVIFRVFAQVTGSNPALPDCLQALSGSFLSSNGGLQGNLALSGNGITAPFTANATSPGDQTDLDGDGDLDLGSNFNPEPAGFVALRADQMIGPRSTRLDGTSVFPPGAEPTAIPNGTEYRIISTLRFLVTGGGGALTQVNFRKRLSIVAVVWSEDADEIVTDNGDGTTAYTYSGGTLFSNGDLTQTGAPVTLFLPEPATLGLAALAGLGLLARRSR